VELILLIVLLFSLREHFFIICFKPLILECFDGNKVCRREREAKVITHNGWAE
jgi:hypothetical protein